MAKPVQDDKKKGDSGNTKEDAIEVMATVKEPLPNAMFRVELEKKNQVLAHVSENAQKFFSHSCGRQSSRRTFALRSYAWPHRVPLQVSAHRRNRENESTGI